MKVTVEGATLPEAVARAAVAVLGLVVPPEAVTEREAREVRAHGRDPEALLARFVSECCYLWEVEGFAGCRVEWVVFQTEPRGGGEPLRCHALLWGEAVDPARHVPRAAALEVSEASVRSLGGSLQVEVAIRS